MAFVVHFSPFDGRWVSSPNPEKNPGLVNKNLSFSEQFCLLFQGRIPFLNPLENNPWLSCLWEIELLKTSWEKEKMLVKPAFSAFPTMFSTHPKGNCNF